MLNINAYLTASNKLNSLKSSTESTVLKTIKNYSVQGLFLILDRPDGAEQVWLEPKQSIQVPELQISQQIKNLHRRRIVQISN